MIETHIVAEQLDNVFKMLKNAIVHVYEVAQVGSKRCYQARSRDAEQSVRDRFVI